MSIPQRLTDRKRVAIVDAAIAEFRVNGFEATSMDKIAATAAVSKRTVYNHFPSKDELFAEILLKLWESSASQAVAPYDGQRSLHEQLMELMRQKMALMDDGNFLDLAKVAIAEAIHSPERAQAMVSKLGDKDAGMTGWIRAAQEDGRLKPCDPAFASQLLQGPLKTFAFWPQITMGQPSASPALQQQVVEAAVGMFLAYYGTNTLE